MQSENQAFAFVITDKFKRLAVLSGSNDDENMWMEFGENTFSHILFSNIQLEIYPESTDKQYNYLIEYKDNAYEIQLLTADLSEELSDKYEISDLIDKLLSDDDCTVIDNTNTKKSVILNINGVNVYISDESIPLMRGIRKKINIRF